MLPSWTVTVSSLPHGYSPSFSFLNSDFSHNNKIGGVTSGSIWFGSSHDFTYAVNREQTIGSDSHSITFTSPKPVHSIPGYNALYLREALDSVNGYDEQIRGCEDWELNYRLRKKGWKLYGIPSSPCQHRSSYTPKSFARQMYNYGWSRARLLKTRHIFTPLHIIPTVGWMLLVILLFLYPPSTFAFPHSVFTTGLALFEKSLESYFFLVSIWSFVLVAKVFTPKLWLQTIGAFIIHHISWALGYLVGLIH